MNRILKCFPLAGLLLLAACGSDEPETTASQTAPSAAQLAAARAAAKAKADDPTAKMAHAVGNGKPGAAVDIRYEFASKPSVGTPTELQVAFIPSAGVDALEATISGMPGITVAGPLTASFASVQPGKLYTHTVSVLPERSGVFYLTVQVSTQIANSSLGRTFSIPFVVGNVPAQQKAAPATDAAGRPIHPMKAQEPKG